MKKKLIIVFDFIFIIIIILIIFFSLLLINIKLVNYLSLKKNEIIKDIENKTGYEIDYKKISPYIIGKIKVHEVTLWQDSTKLELGNAIFDYSLISLLFKPKDYLSILKKVEFNTINLELKKDDLINNIDKFKNRSHNKNQLKFRKKFLISIKNCKIKILDENKDYVFLVNEFNILFNKEIEINSNISFAYNSNNEPLLETTLNINSKIINQNNNISSKTNLDFLNTNILNNKLKIQRFLIESDNKNFTIERINDLLPIKFFISKNENILSTYIDIDKLNVSELFKYKEKSLLLPDNLTFNTNFNYNFDTKNNNGQFVFYSFYNRFLFLRNFVIDFNIRINNNIFFFDKFLISNISNNNFIKILGSLSLNDADFETKILFNDFLLPFNKINTEVTFYKKNNIYNLFFNQLLINGNNLGKFYALAVKNNNRYSIQTINDFNGYSISGEIEKSNNYFNYNLTHFFNNFSIGKIIKSYNDKNIDLSLSGKLTSILKNKKFIIDKDTSFVFLENSNKKFSFNLNYDNEVINLEKFIFYDNLNNKLSAWINLSNKPNILFVNFANDFINYNISLSFFKKVLSLNVNNKLLIDYSILENKIHCLADNFDFLKNNDTKINFNFNLYLNNQVITENTIFIKNLKLFNRQNGYLKANISLYNNVLSIKNLEFNDSINVIRGELITNVNVNDLNFIGKGFFKDNEKDESYSIDFNTIKDNITLKLYVTHFDVSKVEKKISGYANIRINLTGKIISPDFNVDLDLSKAKFGNNELNAYLILQKTKDETTIKKAFLQLGSIRVNINKSSIVTDANKTKILNINGNIFFEGLQKFLKTNFSINGNFISINNEDDPLNIDLTFNNASLGYFEGYDLTKVEKFSDIKFNISRNNKITQISNYGDKFISAELLNKTLNLKFFNNNKMVFDSNFILNKNMNNKMKFIRFPINVLQKILNPFVGIDNGYLDGELNLTGNIANPNFTGELNVLFGVVSLPDYLQEPIQNINGIIIAEKNRFLVKNVNAQVRKGLAHGYGEILLNNWKLESYEFHINSDNIPALIKREPVDAQGIGYIKDLTLEGKLQSYNFIGDFVINSADINLESLMGTNKVKKIKDFPINVYIKFTTGDKIKIKHPLINGIIAQNEVVTLKYVGSEATVYMGGKFSIKKGEVNYVNRIFKTENAEFQFYDDEARINPKVNLKAYYNTKDNKRDSVRVYMTLNDRLVPFKIKFYSLPNKSQEEISSLLGLPLPQNQDEKDKIIYVSNTANDNINPITDTTNYVSNSLIITPIENKVRKITGLDNFSLNTKIFGNIIKSNMDLSSSTYDLLEGTSITVGKYLFNQLYFQSILSFEKGTLADEYFLPIYDQNNNLNYGLNLQFMLQIEFPYMSIGYTLLPKDYFNMLKTQHEISLEANFNF